MKYWDKRLRDKEIFRLFTNESKSTKELASMFNMSQRQIQRILKGGY